jgi:hypothetical protein
MMKSSHDQSSHKIVARGGKIASVHSEQQGSLATKEVLLKIEYVDSCIRLMLSHFPEHFLPGFGAFSIGREDKENSRSTPDQGLDTTLPLKEGDRRWNASHSLPTCS